MLSGNCNPLLSPRETRTPIFDPASFKTKGGGERGEIAHWRVGDESSERQNHVRFKNREKGRAAFFLAKKKTVKLSG